MKEKNEEKNDKAKSHEKSEFFYGLGVRFWQTLQNDEDDYERTSQ